jgi:hypothetical protein
MQAMHAVNFTVWQHRSTQVYLRCQQLLMMQNTVMEAVWCWLQRGAEMPRRPGLWVQPRTMPCAHAVISSPHNDEVLTSSYKSC